MWDSWAIYCMLQLPHMHGHTKLTILFNVIKDVFIVHRSVTSIEIAESKFQKLGYLRSESTTAEQLQNRPVREQHLIVGIIMRIEMHQ